MNRRRRQAHDFTDSLECFRDSTSDPSYETYQSFSEDSLNKNRVDRTNNTARIEKNNPLFVNKTCNVKPTPASCTLEHCAGQAMPDLNKRIDLFQNDSLADPRANNNDLTRTNNENADPQCPNRDADTRSDIYDDASALVEKNTFLERKTFFNNSEYHAGSDSQTDARMTATKSERIIIEQRSGSMVKQMNKQVSADDKCIGNTSLRQQSDDDSRTFESILCSLDNKLNRIKETSHSQRVLTRLSNVYNHSPRKFTEKLLTIIESSVVSSNDEACHDDAVDLSRLSTEFKKMCKFIEDESMPDWPSCLISTPPHAEEVGVSPSSAHAKNISYHQEKSLKSATGTPVSNVGGMQTTPNNFLRKIAKNVFYGTPTSPTGNSSIVAHSNLTFEDLEAHCNRLCTNEQANHRSLRKSLSLPSLMSMSDIQIICEKQMAALDATDNGIAKSLDQMPVSVKTEKEEYPSMEQLNSSQLFHRPNRLKDSQHKNISYTKRKFQKVNVKKTEACPTEVDKSSGVYTMINPDELEKTLLQDIAAKRKRCLDTAKLIMKINADADTKEARKPLSPLLSANEKSNCSSNNEAKFLNTLISCKKYHDYLTEQKPLLSLLQNTNSTMSEITPGQGDSERTESRQAQRPLITLEKSPDMYTSPLSSKSPCFKGRGKQINSNKKTEKSKLFTTPGKSQTNNSCRKKKIYFPSMDTALKSTPTGNIMKSPHAEGLYRLNYNTIVSPVGMYIRGTDTQLIKNVRSNAGSKAKGLLLTPTKENVKNSPTTSSSTKKLSQSQQKCPVTKMKPSPLQCSTPKQKENLTPSQTKVTPTTGKSMSSGRTILPKVSYKLPLQVRTIKGNEYKKTGNRMKELLESAQSKVVIRHAERTNLVKKRIGNAISDDDEVLEINYNPEDESIHIEQAASKTNFIHRHRD